MSVEKGLERCLTFINCQLQPAEMGRRPGTPGGELPKMAVTISREAGSGAHAVADQLQQLLEASAPRSGCPWTVFDRNLVEKVIEEHHLPSSLARFMPEDRISEISDTMDELFGLHPPSWTLVRNISDTILHLAELGNVILIGRGAHVITRKLGFVFHVRLVGSLEKRLEHLQEYRKVSRKAAREFLDREDGGRRRYLKKYFGRDIDDPLLYHLAINTDLVDYGDAARLIATAMLSRAGVAVGPGAGVRAKA